MAIINGFEREHFGVWANAKTEGLVIIKASKHGDYVEFTECEISGKLTQPDAEGNEGQILEDRYEIASLVSNETKDAYELVLKKFKDEVPVVFSFKGEFLKVCKPDFETLETIDEEEKCIFNKMS